MNITFYELQYATVAGKSQYWKKPWEGTSPKPVDWAKGIYAGVFSYSGWYVNNLHYILKE